MDAPPLLATLTYFPLCKFETMGISWKKLACRGSGRGEVLTYIDNTRWRCMRPIPNTVPHTVQTHESQLVEKPRNGSTHAQITIAEGGNRWRGTYQVEEIIGTSRQKFIV